jgi:isoleucyl-tRNA synthetase
MSDFHFIDGPPFVSSDNLHFGHILISVVKSAVLEYQRICCGRNVINQLGYDCHGLPIEMVVNELLKLNTRKDVLAHGVANYNKKCREIINKYSDAWTPIFKSIGRPIPPSTYKTMDCSFMEGVWNVFYRLHEKGLLYRGQRVMPYSPKCNTPLSNFEAGQNYKDVVDISIYVGFRLLSALPHYDDICFPYGFAHEIYIVAWTTTPWTLPSNAGLCVNPCEDYVLMQAKPLSKYIIIGRYSIQRLFPEYTHDHDDYRITDVFRGSELEGLEYEPLFTLAGTGTGTGTGDAKIICDTFVQCIPYEKDKSPGSNVVHLAPAFGEDDFRVCSSSTNLFMPLDDNGFFTCNYIYPCFTETKTLNTQTMFYRDTNALIIDVLESRGLLFKREPYKHSYPFCWRTDTPLIYRATDAWFIAVTKLRAELLANNEKINWIPGHIGKGRFHNWLENTKDWCVSRNRVFGTPLPIWVSTTNPDDYIVIGSIAELRKQSGYEGELTDIHCEFVDSIEIHQNGHIYRRVPEVFDCWFESGSVPYAATYSSGINNNTKYEPCDFICEGIDQTRGWFYTLHVLSTALYNSPAFKNVICCGLILAEDGRKISKRLGNFVSPISTIETYGADALRLYMLRLPATSAENSRFAEADIRSSVRLLSQWENVLLFIEKSMTGSVSTSSELTQFDKWILSRKNSMIRNVREAMDSYEVSRAIVEIAAFIEDFANWYIKFNRLRLKSGDITARRVCCEIIPEFHMIFSPFIPFHNDKFAQMFPWNSSENKFHIDCCPEEIEQQFARFKTACDILRNFRANSKNAEFSSVKMPIETITFISTDQGVLDDLRQMESYFLNEQFHVLHVKYYQPPPAKMEATIDFKYGKIYRSKLKDIQQVLNHMPQLELQELHHARDALGVNLAGVLVDYSHISFKTNTIMGEFEIKFDAALTPEIYEIRFHRALKSQTQQMLKSMGLKAQPSNAQIEYAVVQDSHLLESVHYLPHVQPCTQSTDGEVHRLVVELYTQCHVEIKITIY